MWEITEDFRVIFMPDCVQQVYQSCVERVIAMDESLIEVAGEDSTDKYIVYYLHDDEDQRVQVEEVEEILKVLCTSQE